MFKKQYISFFRIRFTNGLQYRIAAYAGISTQFAWGAMNILMFRAFYRADALAFPMDFSQFASYIWLQQALLAMFALWFWERDIFDAITNGNIAYELVRPVDIYNMWFIRNAAVRLSRVVLRCLPILIVAAFLPEPYNMSMPDNIFTLFLFFISMTLGFLVAVAYCMLFYAISFYVINSTGIRLLAAAIVEFLAGGIVPLPFFPKNVLTVLELLPFASMQHTPFWIYTGYINGKEAIEKILLQVFWYLLLFLLGRLLIKNTLKKVVVQGG